MYKDLEMRKLLEFAKTLKILYVEDNEDSREALCGLLENFFTDITPASDGLDGLEKFKNNNFDLVITDINMPKMNGVEMMHEIRVMDEDIPLLVSTAYQDREFLINCIELGVNEYLLKPINYRQLTRAIKCTCGKLYYIKENKKYETLLEDLVKERTKELQTAQKKLILMANRDPLTNLYNRRYFNEISRTLLSLANREKDGLSLLMIDIDRFKIINDNYGHLAGDAILKKLAFTLLEITRSSDVVIRFGGEEFLILLPHTHLKGAQKIAEKIRNRVKNLKIPLKDSVDEIVKFTVSIGVAECYCGDDKDIDTLVRRADKAMYEAKHDGRDRIVIYKKDMK